MASKIEDYAIIGDCETAALVAPQRRCGGPAGARRAYRYASITIMIVDADLARPSPVRQ